MASRSKSTASSSGRRSSVRTSPTRSSSRTRQAAGRQERQSGDQPRPAVFPDPAVGDGSAEQRRVDDVLEPRPEQRRDRAGDLLEHSGLHRARHEPEQAALLIPAGLTAGKVPGRRRRTAAASGDRAPDISVANADIQAYRVAAVRRLSLARLRPLDLHLHARPRARVLRRTGRERARAEPRSGPTDGRPLMSVNTPAPPSEPRRFPRPRASVARSRCSSATLSSAR